MPRRAARVDTSSAALVKTARELGAYVVPINGVFDCVIHWKGRIFCVDWKSKGGQLTTAQQRLLVDRFPLELISTEQQLRELLSIK